MGEEAKESGCGQTPPEKPKTPTTTAWVPSRKAGTTVRERAERSIQENLNKLTVANFRSLMPQMLQDLQNLEEDAKAKHEKINLDGIISMYMNKYVVDTAGSELYADAGLCFIWRCDPFRRALIMEIQHRFERYSQLATECTLIERFYTEMSTTEINQCEIATDVIKLFRALPADKRNLKVQNNLNSKSNITSHASTPSLSLKAEGSKTDGNTGDGAVAAAPEQKMMTFLDEDMDEYYKEIKRNLYGVCTLIGELYIRKFMGKAILGVVAETLISPQAKKRPTEIHVEAFTGLLYHCGRYLEYVEKSEDLVNTWCQRLSEFLKYKGFSHRIKCILKNALDIRSNKWQTTQTHAFKHDTLELDAGDSKFMGSAPKFDIQTNHVDIVGGRKLLTSNVGHSQYLGTLEREYKARS